MKDINLESYANIIWYVGDMEGKMNDNFLKLVISVLLVVLLFVVAVKLLGLIIGILLPIAIIIVAAYIVYRVIINQ